MFDGFVSPALLGDVFLSWSLSLSCLLPSLLSKLFVSIHPPVPFYQSPVGTVSQSGQACPLLCPCTG